MDFVYVKNNFVHGISFNSLKSGKLEDLSSKDDLQNHMLVIKIYQL